MCICLFWHVGYFEELDHGFERRWLVHRFRWGFVQTQHILTKSFIMPWGLDHSSCWWMLCPSTLQSLIDFRTKQRGLPAVEPDYFLKMCLAFLLITVTNHLKWHLCNSWSLYNFGEVYKLFSEVTFSYLAILFFISMSKVQWESGEVLPLNSGYSPIMIISALHLGHFHLGLISIRWTSCSFSVVLSKIVSGS